MSVSARQWGRGEADRAAEPGQVTDGRAARAGGRWAGLRELVAPVGIYVASRLVMLMAAGFAALINATTGRSNGTGPWPAVPAARVGALAVLERWDSAWYISVAQHGYPARPVATDLGRVAFFPLYPLLTRGLAAVGLPVVDAALIMSTMFGGAAAVLLFFLAKRTAGVPAAVRVTALFCFFPGAFVLSMAYSEGLMLTAAVGCLWALVERRWLLAGLAAAVATATRPTAVALCFACAWAAGQAIAQRRDWRSLIAPALSPLGVLAYFGYLAVHTGHVSEWFRSERVIWHEHVDPAGLPGRLYAGLRHPVGVAGPLRDINGLVALAGAVVLVAGLVLLLRQRPAAPIVVYTVITVVLILTSKTIGARPRLVLAAFPVIAAIGTAVTGWRYFAVLGGSAVLMGGLSVLAYTTLAATP